MIVALAGRRIDAADAPAPRFPATLVDAVRARIREALRARGATALVSAAACGADLAALEEAAALGLRRRIVLPFAPNDFRARSVADRPGAWGALFDRYVADAQAAGELRLLGLDVADPHAFQKANAAILDEAQGLARGGGEAVTALVVWDGPLTARTDYTADFARDAAARGIAVDAIPIRQP